MVGHLAVNLPSQPGCGHVADGDGLEVEFEDLQDLAPEDVGELVPSALGLELREKRPYHMSEIWLGLHGRRLEDVERGRVEFELRSSRACLLYQFRISHPFQRYHCAFSVGNYPA